MGIKIYGVLDSQRCHIDISTSLKATKRKATMDGYTEVSVRDSDHYYVSVVSKKVDGKWVDDAR